MLIALPSEARLDGRGRPYNVPLHTQASCCCQRHAFPGVAPCTSFDRNSFQQL